MNWQTVLIIGHIVGTVLGVGGSTFAEIFHRKAGRDQVVDETEKSFLRTTYAAMRVGMVLLVLSGFGLLLLLRLEGSEQYLYSPRLWAKLVITLVIIVNALLLHLRRMPLGFGSAISLTSWYVALVIGAWRFRADFFTIMLGYVIAVFVVAAALKLIHSREEAKT